MPKKKKGKKKPPPSVVRLEYGPYLQSGKVLHNVQRLKKLQGFVDKYDDEGKKRQRLPNDASSSSAIKRSNLSSKSILRSASARYTTIRI